MIIFMKKQALGVDIGNVIINHRLVVGNDPTFFEEQYSSIPASEGVFEALNELNSYFNGEVYLISKCTEWAEVKILQWLEDNHFYEKTGVIKKNVYFVRARQDKDVVCRKLGITHFVDDRLEVLSHMVESTPYLFLFQPNQKEVDEFKAFLPKVIPVQEWGEVCSRIKIDMV